MAFLTLYKLPLLLHAIIESAAASTFILNPASQLPPTSLSPPSYPHHPEDPPSPPLSSSSISLSSSTSSLYQRRSSPSPTPTQNQDLPTTEINLILLNYGGLLVTTNLVCFIFLLRPGFDEISALVSLCIATYHVWPIYRAVTRLHLYHNVNKAGTGGEMVGGKGEKGGNKKVLGGPVVHLVVHVGLLVGLVWSGLSA